jgi:hypothetical protein
LIAKLLALIHQHPKGFTHEISLVKNITLSGGANNRPEKAAPGIFICSDTDFLSCRAKHATLPGFRTMECPALQVLGQLNTTKDARFLL